MSEIHQILEKYWGYKSFRPLQEDIILSIISKKDTLALLPTGGGKSVCFQVPALFFEGICIVITPLIALMKDQVENLKKVGINAVSIYSGMSKFEVDKTLDNCVYGDVKFLYCSPERLKTEIFKERVKKMKVGLLAVDEAHCISQWGYDFRPPYLEISEFREIIPSTPCIALTASATSQVCEDIQNKLAFNEKNIFKKSFARSNLSYSTFYCENKEEKLLDILTKVAGTSVVYVRNRNKTKQIAYFLQKNHISADYYHAGLENKERERKQKDWINNKIRVIVSTNAFGMGIDKPDVRTVVHVDLPDNPEAYYQEAGRAGRDEKLAYAVLLYDLSDIESLNSRVEITHPDVKTIKKTYQALSNYYNLAVGSAFMEEFEFDLAVFCTRYNLPSLPTYYAIKKLQQQGIIQLNESFSVSSKLHVLMNNNDLYAFQIANKYLDDFIKLILRIYGGELFNHHLNISEKDIAKKGKLELNEVYKKIEILKQNEVIDYVRQTEKPKITFLTPRQDANKLTLDVRFLKSQKELMLTKSKLMIDYASATNRCRTLMILAFFDEISEKECDICDVCLKKKKEKKLKSKFYTIRKSIIEYLEENPCTLNQLSVALGKFKKDELSDVISEMLDVNELHLNDEQKLSLK